MELILLWLVLISVLIQGGYFPTVFLLIAVFLSIAVLFRKKRVLSLPEQALWIFAAVYLFSSLANGYKSDSLAQACLPCSCALFLYHYCGLTKVQKGRLLNGIITASGLFSGAAILVFCGVVPLAGAVTAHRLQFTFQYANAAGTWFAAVSLMAQGREKMRNWSLPCITALLLTRSVGALATYGLLQMFCVYRRRKEADPWRETLLLHLLAGLFAVLFFFVSGWIALPLLAVLYLAARQQQAILKLAFRLHLHWIALVVGVCGAAAALFSQRVMTSLLTFTERISQIIDGAAIIADYPLLGIGAGNWAYFYPYYQSAQYTSTVVHCSVIQIGVDSGLIGIAAAAIFLVFAWRQRSRGRIENSAAALLLLHSLLDFNLQFFPIDALLLSLLFYDPETGEKKNSDSFGYARTVCLMLAAGILCSVMLYSELEVKQMIYLSQRGNWGDAANLFETRRTLFGESVTARENYIRALTYIGAWRQALQASSGAEHTGTEELLMRAQAMVELGDQEGACELLLSELDKQRYRVMLFEQTAKRLTEWGAEERYITAYNQIVDQANGSITLLGKLQGDKKIEHLE